MSKQKTKTRYKSSVKGLNIFDGLNIVEPTSVPMEGFSGEFIGADGSIDMGGLTKAMASDSDLDATKATPLSPEQGPIMGSFGAALKEGFKSGAFNGIAGTIGQGIGSAIGGGMHSGVGDAIGGLSSMASAIPGPWGAVASAGLGIVGGGINALVGSKLNKENINAVNTKISKLNSMTADAGSYDTLASNWANTEFGANFSKSYIGKDGLWGNKAKKKYRELKAKQELANAYAENTLIENANNLAENTMNNLEANYAAYGGNLFKGGSTDAPVFNPYKKVWTRGGKPLKSSYTKPFGRTVYTKDGIAIDYGHDNNELRRRQGTQTEHIQDTKKRRTVEEKRRAEEQMYFDRDKELSDSVKVISKRYGLNPELVASRMAKEGIDNAIKDYNFSGGESLVSARKNIKGSDFGLNDIHTDIGEGKVAIKEPWVKYTPADFIDEHGRNTKTGIFENMGGIISATAAELKGRRDALQKAFPHMSADELDAAASASFRKGAYGVKADIRNGKAGYLPGYAPFINLKAFGGDLQTHGASFPTGFTAINNGGSHEENPYEGVFMGMGSNGKPNLVEEGETIYDDFVFSDRITVPKSLRTKYKLRGKKDMTFSDAAKQLSKLVEERPNDPIARDTMKEVLPEFMQAQTKARDEYNMKNQFSKGGNLFSGGGEKTEANGGNSSSYASFLRYAPVVGDGLALMHNILTPTDYSAADTLYNEANNLGKVKTVGFSPIGGYLTYKPMDRDYYLNKLNAVSSASRRAIMDSSGGNRGKALMGILANDYNTLGKIGDFARTAKEYNDKQRQTVGAYNMAIDKYNTEGALKADMANQSAANAANAARIDGIAKALQWGEAADTARNAAIASNYSGLFSNLGNIGVDEYNRKDRDWTLWNILPTLSEKPQGWSDEDFDKYKAARAKALGDTKIKESK